MYALMIRLLIMVAMKGRLYMKFIAQYTVTLNGRRSVKSWIRPEFTPNHSSCATRFDSKEAAQAYVDSLRMNGLVSVRISEVSK